MTTLGGNKDVKVAVVVNHLSHYRVDVYGLLSVREGYAFKYFGDNRPREGIASIGSDSALDHNATETVNFGPLLWQRGVNTRKLVRDNDVIICLGDARMMSTWRIAILARRAKKKVLFWTHGWSRPEHGLKRHLRLIFYKLAHGILVYSRRGMVRAVEYGLQRENVFIVGNGLGTRSALPDKLECSTDTCSDKLVVGAVTRVTKARNFDLLLRSLSLLADTGRPVEFHLAGDGEALQPLKRLAESLNVRLVDFGSIYEPMSLKKFYEGVDICVFPSSGGLAIIQSLSFGVPVICGDDLDGHGPEVEAVIPYETGFYFKANDEFALAEALEQYATLSAKDRAAMADSARALVYKEWTADYQAEKVLEAIEVVLSR